jgi:hypothetical protein
VFLSAPGRNIEWGRSGQQGAVGAVSKQERHTSVAVVDSAVQSMRGIRLMSSWGLRSISSCTSSASLGCRGYESDELLQVFTAQARKFRLRTFILSWVVGCPSLGKFVVAMLDYKKVFMEPKFWIGARSDLIASPT